jgi:hypothetical protein
VQILDGDHIVGVDQGSRNVVLKVRPLVFHRDVSLLEPPHGFAAIFPPRFVRAIRR